MAVEKFSQIPAASSPPAAVDYLVGVTAGGVDQRFTLPQVQQTAGGFPPVSKDSRFNAGTGQLELFVATTGNDSNPGTLASPFATIQQAINVASTFSYEHLYQPQISIAAGTYTLAAPTVVTELFYMGQFNLGLILGAGIGSTIISAQGLTTAFACQSTALSDWSIQLLSIDCNQKCIRVFGTADMFCANMEFKDTSNSGNMVCMFAQDYAIAELDNCTVTTTTFAALIQTRFQSQGFYIGTLALPVSLTVTGGFLDAMQNTSIQFTPAGITNYSGVTGPKLNLHGQSGVWTNNASISDIPGTTLGSVDSSCVIANQNTVFPFSISTASGNFGPQQSGFQILSNNCWTVAKETSSGNVYLLYNDGGAYKQVALSAFAAPPNPTTLITGAGGFWRADMGTTLSGSNVTQWNDQSTFTNNLTNNGTASNVTFSATGFNSSFPGISLADNSNGTMRAAAAFASTATASIFMLMTPNNSTPSVFLRWGWLFSNSTGNDFGTPGFTIFVGSGVAPNFNSQSSTQFGAHTLLNGVPILIGLTFDGAHVSTYINGGLAGPPVAFSSNIGDTSPTFGLGNDKDLFSNNGAAAGATYAFWGITQKAMTGMDWFNLKLWANANWGTVL